jgi:hypothetical protein
MAHRRKNWREHLRRQRRIARYEASLEATVIEARLQANLSWKQWCEIESKWMQKDDLDAYLPQQRLDFLIGEARHLGMLDLVPLAAFGG